jgi:hypothetical protein
VRRWIWLAGGVIIAGSLLAHVGSRLLGLQGSRPATLLSVVTGWLAAWVLWSFAGGLAARHGLLETYDGSLFALVAVGGGLWQYRMQLRQGREVGLAIFVGAQLVWLGVVLLQNGALTP